MGEGGASGPYDSVGPRPPERPRPRLPRAALRPGTGSASSLSFSKDPASSLIRRDGSSQTNKETGRHAATFYSTYVNETKAVGSFGGGGRGGCAAGKLLMDVGGSAKGAARARPGKRLGETRGLSNTTRCSNETEKCKALLDGSVFFLYNHSTSFATEDLSGECNL